MISLLRKEYFLSQKDIAIFLGMSQSNYSDFENNNILKNKCKYLIKLCILYNVSLDFLCGITTKYSEVSNRNELIDKYNIDRDYLKYLENKMKLSKLKVEDIDISRTRENVNKILNQR